MRAAAPPLRAERPCHRRSAAAGVRARMLADATPRASAHCVRAHSCCSRLRLCPTVGCRAGGAQHGQEPVTQALEA
jgi:hypothetical protein